MAEQLVSQSIPALQDMNKMALYAIQLAKLITLESDLYAGKFVHLVGLILVHSVSSGQTLMEKDAAVLSSVVVVGAMLVTLIRVALA